MSHSHDARQLETLLGLSHSPVAVSFLPQPPEGAKRVDAPAAAGCAYWKRASQGEVFYTVSEDHLGCAVGAYTHGVELSDSDQRNLANVLTTMTGLSYLDMAEVPSIPARRDSLNIVSYAPLALSPAAPSVVLLKVKARSAMLLDEAALSAGVRGQGAGAVRPACSVIPKVLGTERTSSTLGCIGNRVYTELRDDELWYAIPGQSLGAVLERLAAVVRANVELEQFHRARLRQDTGEISGADERRSEAG